MQSIIEVKHLGKKYDITHQRGGYIALRDVLTNVLRSPFSFARTKAKRAIGLEKHEEFWALKDVSFSIGRGETIGIIGRNGAGKSTLLKILSQITPPTEGEAILRGRVSSLLEVGTGFHPELTGRENIFLNGAILGMSRREIARKFDEIVAFAGIERFLDTPVKRYSSGMYVRLAFSVAAHIEPDILIVDEVLAVGDAEFQKKCIGKMEEVTKKEGRTIIFVSHNMAAIESLCDRCILLEHGKVKEIGATEDVIEHYMAETPAPAIIKQGDADARILSCRLINEKGKGIESAFLPERIGIEIAFEVQSDTKDIFPNYALYSADDVTVLHSLCPLQGFGKGTHTVISWLPPHLLNNKKYRVKVAIMSTVPQIDHAIQEFYFEMHEPPRENLHGYLGEIHGVVRPVITWEKK